MFIVRAFDTDYGCDCSWNFSSENMAQEWANALRYDYGDECQVVVYKGN